MQSIVTLLGQYFCLVNNKATKKELYISNISITFMTRKIKEIMFLASLMMLIASCSTPKNINYMEDSPYHNVIRNASDEITVQQGDRLAIFVKSKDDVLTQHFNISLPNMQNVLTYTVNNRGEIDFPMLGAIHLAGLTRNQAAETIKNRLISEYGTKDAVVTLDFTNLKISVLGEVNKPGTISIDNDNINIYEAMGKAGDMTIYGKRDSVRVVRRQGDETKIYVLNLASAQETMQSPAYYLQQNYIVYVPANKTRQRQATLNGNTLQSTSFWVSIASLLTTIAVLVFK